MEKIHLFFPVWARAVFLYGQELYVRSAVPGEIFIWPTALGPHGAALLTASLERAVILTIQNQPLIFIVRMCADEILR